MTTAAGQAKLWNDLSGKEKVAAELLGFNQVSILSVILCSFSFCLVLTCCPFGNQETWDNDGKVSVDRKTWKELQPAQQRAASVLAIDKDLWDKEVFVDVYERSWVELTKGVYSHMLELLVSEKIGRKEACAHIQPHMERNKTCITRFDMCVMITAQKDSANLLGFDKTSWDEERHVWSDDVYWRQLTLSQQAAAENIGYTQEVWFVCTFGIHLCRACAYCPSSQDRDLCRRLFVYKRFA